MDVQTLATLMTTAKSIIILSIVGLIPALFSYFLDFCFWRYNVFAFWLPWLSKQIIKKFHPMKYQNFMAEPDKTKRDKRFLDEAGHNPYYKLLGGCAICMNFWMCLATYPLLIGFTGISWYYPIVFILSAHFYLRKWMKVD